MRLLIRLQIDDERPGLKDGPARGGRRQVHVRLAGGIDLGLADRAGSHARVIDRPGSVQPAATTG